MFLEIISKVIAKYQNRYYKGSAIFINAVDINDANRFIRDGWFYSLQC